MLHDADKPCQSDPKKKKKKEKKKKEKKKKKKKKSCLPIQTMTKTLP